MNSATSTPILQVDKHRILLGASMALLSAIIFCIRYTLQDGVFFAVLFLAAGFLKLNSKHPLVGFLINGIWGVVTIFITCSLPTVMVSESSYLAIGSYRIVMNFLCVAVIYGIFLAVTGKIKSAVAIASGLFLILATINGFVWQFRGNMLKPMDILFVKTAMNVAGQYAFQINRSMAFCWTLWIWTVFFLGSLPKECDIFPRMILRLGAILAAAACAVVFWQGTEDIKMNTWSNEGATRNGYFLNFTVGFRDFFVEAPEGYSLEAIEELEKKYSDQSTIINPESLPNIIVIMNESFADFNILGTQLRTNQPVTPFLDALQENTIRGYALTSIFGGTTANSEFEFLTGLSMANTPEGSCPYQQHITSKTFSIAHVLASCGYKTFATHPYFATGWNRLNVYPHIGFDDSTFIEAYPHEDLLREYISDQEMYNYVLDCLYAETEVPLFLFGITMQNHGDYNYEGPNYEQSIVLEGYEMDHPMTEQYLTLIHESDKAVEYLLTELESYPEDTIVLFFGDHLPQIEGDFLLEAHGGAYETISEQQRQYTVPFFIWANFDIPEQDVDCTSLNYLGRYLLDAAGIPLPPFYRFLADMEQVIPSLNAKGFYSPTAGTYLPYEDAQGEEAHWLDQYAIMQHNIMFDKNHLNNFFFGRYLNQN